LFFEKFERKFVVCPTPTRPEPSPWKGQRGKGEYKEVKGFRLYLIDTDRIVHLISWHQVQDDEEFAQGLLQIREKCRLEKDIHKTSNFTLLLPIYNNVKGRKW